MCPVSTPVSTAPVSALLSQQHIAPLSTTTTTGQHIFLLLLLVTTVPFLSFTQLPLLVILLSSLLTNCLHSVGSTISGFYYKWVLLPAVGSTTSAPPVSESNYQWFPFIVLTPILGVSTHKFKTNKDL